MAKRKSKSNFKLVVLSILGVLIIGGGLFGYHFYNYIYMSNVKMESESTLFVIESDWDFDKISEELYTQGIIKNKESFIWVAQQKKYDQNPKPGRFKIQNGWSNSDLINHIRLKGNSAPIQVTFHNISRLTQLASKISNQIEADSADLMDAFLNPDWMKENGLKKETVQAIFIPNTYELYWNTSAEQFTRRMLQEFNHFWTPERRKLAEKLNLDPFSLSTLASIVEAETKKSDEMPKVAGLYLNRLHIGMKLQSDPTVVFALNRPGVHRVYYEDLKIESPYNTYLYAGLPPGPIGFPSNKALKAVLNRDDNSYLYMCAKPDYSGYHNFATSYSQHQRNASKYRAFLTREGIR